MSDATPCPNHPNEPKLGYLSACADAERRLKRREQQWKCGRCGLWVWGEFMVDMKGSASEAMIARRQKEAEREARRAK